MKKLVATALFLGLFTASLAHAAIPDELARMPIKMLDGRTVSLEDFKGKKPVYLKFWATWCQTCLREMAHFEEVYKRYSEDINVISINLGINDQMADVEKLVEKYGLTMPMAIDSNGALADKFNFVGTPYHLLFDKELNLVHKGHESNETLANKMNLLASNKTAETINPQELVSSAADLDLSKLSQGSSAIFFTATWCDWYLAEITPKQSTNCAESIKTFNELAKKYPNVQWLLVVSHLWTGEKDLADYSKKHHVTVQSYIDASNSTFLKHEVNNFPTLIVQSDGKEKYRTTQLADDKTLVNVLDSL